MTLQPIFEMGGRLPVAFVDDATGEMLAADTLTRLYSDREGTRARWKLVNRDTGAETIIEAVVSGDLEAALLEALADASPTRLPTQTQIDSIVFGSRHESVPKLIIIDGTVTRRR